MLFVMIVLMYIVNLNDIDRMVVNISMVNDVEQYLFDVCDQ